MATRIATISTILLPKASGSGQSVSHVFASFAVPAGAAGIVVHLSWSSPRPVQLPVALHGPDGRARLCRADEPAMGDAHLEYRPPGDVGSFAGVWKLVLHKRILGAPLPLTIGIDAVGAVDAVDGVDAGDTGDAVDAGDAGDLSDASDTDAAADTVAATQYGGRIGAFGATDTSGSAAVGGGGFAEAVPDPGPGWYCGELHLHSDASTGRTGMDVIRRVALERGLDFLAPSDHFTFSHWDRIEALDAAGEPPLFLRSAEIAGDRGHANLHGIVDWPDPYPDDCDGAVADFLGRPLAGGMEAAADAIHAQGGLFCINHPLSAGVSWRYDEFPFRKADLLEVASLPDGPASFLYPVFWDRLLCAGLRLTGVGSSDSHDPLQDGPWALGRIRNWVYADSLSRRGILDGLRSGRVFVAVGEARLDVEAFVESRPDLPLPMGSTVEPGPGEGCTVRVSLSRHGSGNLFVIGDGLLRDVVYFPAGEGPDIAEFPVPAGAPGRDHPSYLRFEFHEDLEKARYHGMAFRDHRSLRLLSNPVWIRRV